MWLKGSTAASRFSHISFQSSPTCAGSGGRQTKASMVAAQACMSTARTEPPM
ncbi:hypothetical protein SBADM41S_02741 [Streptomyces badius]